MDLATENERLLRLVGRLNWRVHHAITRVTDHLDQTEPCAALAVDVRDILTGARDPQQAPP